MSQMTETQKTDGAVNEAGESPFSTIEEGIEEIRRGHMVVVCDGEDRENEGDLVMRRSSPPRRRSTSWPRRRAG